MRKSKVFLAFGAVLLLIACVSISGCVSQLIGDAEDPVEVPVFTPVPTPTPTSVPFITYTPSPTPTPKLPGTFVGNWTREFPASGFDETVEFKNEKSFSYVLVVTDEKIYNEYNRGIDESYLYNGFSIENAGLVVKMSGGNYRLRVNYCAIHNPKGLLMTETKLSDSKMFTLADLTYDKETDSLVMSTKEQTTRFKRIN